METANIEFKFFMKGVCTLSRPAFKTVGETGILTLKGVNYVGCFQSWSLKTPHLNGHPKHVFKIPPSLFNQVILSIQKQGFQYKPVAQISYLGERCQAVSVEKLITQDKTITLFIKETLGDKLNIQYVKSQQVHIILNSIPYHLINIDEILSLSKIPWGSSPFNATPNKFISEQPPQQDIVLCSSGDILSTNGFITLKLQLDCPKPKTYTHGSLFNYLRSREKKCMQFDVLLDNISSYNDTQLSLSSGKYEPTVYLEIPYHDPIFGVLTSINTESSIPSDATQDVFSKFHREQHQGTESIVLTIDTNQIKTVDKEYLLEDLVMVNSKFTMIFEDIEPALNYHIITVEDVMAQHGEIFPHQTLILPDRNARFFGFKRIDYSE
jgi:hypothetical protein